MVRTNQGMVWEKPLCWDHQFASAAVVHASPNRQNRKRERRTAIGAQDCYAGPVPECVKPATKQCVHPCYGGVAPVTAAEPNPHSAALPSPLKTSASPCLCQTLRWWFDLGLCHRFRARTGRVRIHGSAPVCAGSGIQNLFLYHSGYVFILTALNFRLGGDTSGLTRANRMSDLVVSHPC